MKSSSSIPTLFTSEPWPLTIGLYERSPDLRKEEHEALTHLFTYTQKFRRMHEPEKLSLQRLLCPLNDVLCVAHAPKDTYFIMFRIICIEMYQRKTTFWAWSVDEWLAILSSSSSTFAERYHQKDIRHPARSYLPLIPYLLKTLPDAWRILEQGQLSLSARRCFGKAPIDETTKRLRTVLQSWGYHQKAHGNFDACLSYLLLRNGSPRIEDLTSKFIEQVVQNCALACVRDYIFQISRALLELGVIDRVFSEKNGKSQILSGTDGSVSREWLSWCQRWHGQTTLTTHGVYYNLLKVGRWLMVFHPEVTSPADWTYELAMEYITVVNDIKIGEWSSPLYHQKLSPGRVGQPLRPEAKNHMLQAMRVFLRDCQEYQWIPVRLNPDRALRTPRSIWSVMGPNPRIVDKEIWAKVLWAAMNLKEEDLSEFGGNLIYPVEMVRAIAAVWCFAALRSNEIVRLRVGCVRWQYEDVMIPETGEILPKDATCFLDIPVNKTGTAYTKPVHPFVGKCINEWEHIRPKVQPKALDRKTSESVQYLFSYRSQRLSKDYINESLILYLCRKAGVPNEDSRGRITSHRARATIASMLYNAKNPLDIFQLQKYLGHKQISSTQHYVAVDPTKLASQVAKAGYLEQNLATIEVLLDQDAVRSGAAARGEPWKYYDLGHGYCLNDFWAECKHRMACARCPFYRPKESLKDQLLEGQANLLRMLEFVQLTNDEKLLVTEGVELHQALIEQLADMPTPTGLTPREMETLSVGETTVIPVRAVQRKARKTRDE